MERRAAPGGGMLLSTDTAWQWLSSRWGNGNRLINTYDYVEHFVLLEVTISGWTSVNADDAESLVLNLHRYQAQGKSDPLNGAWRIDAILY